MALIELYSIICVYGLGSSRAIIFGSELAMKGESLGHHAATQALVFSDGDCADREFNFSDPALIVLDASRKP